MWFLICLQKRYAIEMILKKKKKPISCIYYLIAEWKWTFNFVGCLKIGDTLHQCVPCWLDLCLFCDGPSLRLERRLLKERLLENLKSDSFNAYMVFLERKKCPLFWREITQNLIKIRGGKIWHDPRTRHDTIRN